MTRCPRRISLGHSYEPCNKARPDYLPTRAALLLTNRCNLNCLYCYSSAGSSPKAELSREAAFAAVDLIVENARRLGTTAYLILHGGGEPSCAWRLLQAVVDHFETRSRQGEGRDVHGHRYQRCHPSPAVGVAGGARSGVLHLLGRFSGGPGPPTAPRREARAAILM